MGERVLKFKKRREKIRKKNQKAYVTECLELPHRKMSANDAVDGAPSAASRVL